MTTGTGKIKVSDCASYTIIPSWASFALLLATLVIVGTCSTVSGYIGTPRTECSWRTDVANTSVLPQEGWIGTRTVTHIVPINVRLPHRYTYGAIITRCAEVCWRCQIPSITVFTRITVHALLFHVQPKPVAVCPGWARTPIKTCSLWTVVTSWTDAVSNRFISRQFKWEAIESLGTWITLISSR